MPETVCGGCHCGNISLSFHAATSFEALPIRACQCSFCRKHNVRATADPDGHLEVAVRDQGKLSRYRMGHGVTDFIVCRDCGVYVCAVMEDDEMSQLLATCIVNALDLPENRIKSPVAAHYDAESPSERLERRRKRWMRATVV